MIDYEKNEVHHENYTGYLFEEMKMIYTCKINSSEVWTKDLGHVINCIFRDCTLGAGHSNYPRRTIYSMCHFHDCKFNDEPAMFINCKFDNCSFKNKDRMHFQKYTIHKLKGE